MTVAAEFYNSKGELILSNADTALIDSGVKLYIPCNSMRGTNYLYNEDINLFQDAQTGGTGITAYWLGYTIANATTAPKWFRPHNNANVLWFDNKSIGLSRSGEGITILTTPVGNLNQYAGYLDVFKEDGSLAWSINSVIQAPKIVDVIHIPDTMYTSRDVITIDLSKYGYDVNKMYINPTFMGRVYMDEYFFDYMGLLVKRSGNFLYLRGFIHSGGTINTFPMSQVFGAGGMYIPLAYFPNS